MFGERCPKCGKRMKRVFRASSLVDLDLVVKISKWKCRKCGYSVVYADSIEYNGGALFVAWCGIGVGWGGIVLQHLGLPSAVWVPFWAGGLIIMVGSLLRFRRKLGRAVNPDLRGEVRWMRN